nr:hypothetical protein [Tanacetum cinerariifolium]
REKLINTFRDKIVPSQNGSRGFFFKPNPGFPLERERKKHKLNRRTWYVWDPHRRGDLVEVTDPSELLVEDHSEIGLQEMGVQSEEVQQKLVKLLVGENYDGIEIECACINWK